MATFGKTSLGALTAVVAADYKQVCKHTLGEVAVLSSISIGLGGNTPGSQGMRAVIYRDSAGAPAALVAASGERVFSGVEVMAFQVFPMPPRRLVPGDYWLGFIAGSAGEVVVFSRDDVADTRKYNLDFYSDGPDNPFGTPDATDQYEISVYATATFLSRETSWVGM